MLIQCESGITEEQVADLQKYKTASATDVFDTSKLNHLVSVDFSQFDMQDNEAGNQISFSNVENAMLN